MISRSALSIGLPSTNSNSSAFEDSEKLEQQTHSIVLLGQEGTGKSTIAKQFEVSQRGSIDNRHAEEQICGLRTSLFRVVVELFSHKDVFELASRDTVDEMDDIRFLDAKDDEEVSMMREKLAIIWADPVVRKAFKNRNDFLELPQTYGKILERRNAERFMADFSRVFERGFHLNSKDYLRVWCPTGTPKYISGDVNDVAVTFVDVGGQKHIQTTWKEILRKKNDYDVVVYVASLSDYSINVGLGNRLETCLETFRDLMQDKHIDAVPLLVVFNKSKMFSKKTIFEVPLGECPLFEGESLDTSNPLHEETCVAKIKKLYEEAHNEFNSKSTRPFGTIVLNLMDPTSIYTIMSETQRLATKQNRGLIGWAGHTNGGNAGARHTWSAVGGPQSPKRVRSSRKRGMFEPSCRRNSVGSMEFNFSLMRPAKNSNPPNADPLPLRVNSGKVFSQKTSFMADVKAIDEEGKTVDPAPEMKAEHAALVGSFQKAAACSDGLKLAPGSCRLSPLEGSSPKLPPSIDPFVNPKLSDPPIKEPSPNVSPSIDLFASSNFPGTVVYSRSTDSLAGEIGESRGVSRSNSADSFQLNIESPIMSSVESPDNSFSIRPQVSNGNIGAGMQPSHGPGVRSISPIIVSKTVLD